MKDISFTAATPANAEEIASLHALSWQRHYRGIYPDSYLDNQVTLERRKIWLERFQQPNDNQYVIQARDQDLLIGFACTLIDKDDTYGALVDNLHVLREYQGRGLGKILLRKCAEWVLMKAPATNIYLYVLKENHAALGFYTHLGADLSPVLQYQSPAGTVDEVIRCTWDPANLKITLTN